jgi:phosphatidylinositol dimannoside acyltransferase
LAARATYFAYRGLGEAMQALPEPVARLASRLVTLALTSARAESRAMYGRHLRRVLGNDLTESEVRRWTTRAFLAYSRYWMEGARLPAVPRSEILERMVWPQGMEHLVEGMRAGKGVIMALPHVGSWEWGGAWLALQGYPMVSVAEPIEPPELYDWFVEQREQMGLDILKLGAGSGTALLKALHDGRLVGLLCDRDIPGNGVEVEFFGERTTFPSGPATLALRTGAVLLPTVVYSGPGRDHSAVIRPPLPTERTTTLRKDVARVTQAIAYEFEAFVRRAPDQWHLFQPNWPSDTEEQTTGTDNGPVTSLEGRPNRPGRRAGAA